MNGRPGKSSRPGRQQERTWAGVQDQQPRQLRVTDTPIVVKQGRLHTTEAEQVARWAEHFSEVLNRTPPRIEVEVQDPDTDLDVSTASPEKEEIMTAIRSLDNGKASGQDSL